MSTLSWNDVLQGAEANKGSVPLQPGDYNFKVASAEGKTAQSGREMISVRLEIIDGPYAGKTAWHNWVLPNDNSDKAKTSMGYFLGDMEVFGLTKDWFIQNIGGQAMTKATCDFIAAQIVNQVITASVSFQKNDPTRNDIKRFRKLEATPGSAPAAPFGTTPFGAPAGVPQPQFGAPAQAPMQQPMQQPQYQPPMQAPVQQQFEQPQQQQFPAPGAAPVVAPAQFAAPPVQQFAPPQVQF